VIFTVKNDVVFDPDETIIITLSPPTGGAVLGSLASTTITVVDDDTAVSSTGAADGTSGSPSPATNTKNTDRSVGGGGLSRLQLLALGLALLWSRRSRGARYRTVA
jgi:hypothetical protein